MVSPRIKRSPWFNKYYFIIIVIGVLIGLFIWFFFRTMLYDLEQKKAYPENGGKPTSINK